MKSDDYLPIDSTTRSEFKKFYTWGIDEAIAAQEKWKKPKRTPEAKGPLFKWIAAQKLKEIADEYRETGAGNLILQAIYECGKNDLPMPKWCAYEYLKKYRDVYFSKVTKWDDAFGRPWPKGTHKKDFRKYKSDALRVKERVEEIIKNEGTPIDGELFKRVGRKLGVGAATKTSELYYYAKNELLNLLSR